MRSPDIVGIACPRLAACCHLCGIQAVVCSNVHAVQALIGKIVLVWMRVNVEARGCIACQPLALLCCPGKLPGGCLPPLNVNDLLSLCLGPLGMLFLLVPAEGRWSVVRLSALCVEGINHLQQFVASMGEMVRAHASYFRSLRFLFFSDFGVGPPSEALLALSASSKGLMDCSSRSEASSSSSLDDERKNCAAC